jgi:hypothetical protein
MESNKVTIKKIPLNYFIDSLIDIYNSGIDYIDLVGILGPKRDSVQIVTNEQYLKSDKDMETKVIKPFPEDDIDEIIII